MFGGKKKLYSEGAQADGVVVKEGWSNDRIHYRLVVRARFPDGSTTDFNSQFLDIHDVGSLHQGSVVPVRYDPSDHSKIVLDMPILEARHQQATAAQEAQLDAQVAHLGESGAQPPGGTAAQALTGLTSGGDLREDVLQALGQNPGSVIHLNSSQPSADQAKDPVDRLAKLAALKQQGLLTDEEFTTAKAKILGES